MSTETFWSQVGAYNQATWPVQAILVVAAVFVVVRVVLRPGATTDVLAKVFLALAFAWNAGVFFLGFARNPISMFTGVPLFIVVTVLFAVDVFAKRTAFRLPEGRWMRGLTILWILSVFLYPVLGWPLGHTYPRVALPMMPCPLTVFAIALVAAAAPRVDKKVFVFLLPWALLGLPKCFGALDCYEDCVLFASGVYGLIVLVRNWRAESARGTVSPRTAG
jgi:hypothetical protein